MGKVTSKRMPKPKKNISKFSIGRKIAVTLKRTYICLGGPLHGTKLALLTPKTFTFKIKNQIGYYSDEFNDKLNVSNLPKFRKSAPLIHWHEVN